MQSVKNKRFTIVGTMSGTSIDGLDVCVVDFFRDTYDILYGETFLYPKEMRDMLRNAHLLSGIELSQLHVDYGIFCGKLIDSVLSKTNIHAHYIVSHGHTVFHTPHTGLTLQIGSGPHIAKQTGVPTIYNMRELDVAFGGQGAPLVPIGDEVLFNTYEYCLNIGGFANVSSKINGVRVAWDICPANIVINSLVSEHYNKEFDDSGSIGREGNVNDLLLNDLQSLRYYAQCPPKSLGREWVEAELFPVFQKHAISPADQIRTFYEHCALQIGSVLSEKQAKALCTGGGVYNSFLMERIVVNAKSELIIPNNQLVDFKEALIFAFLGYQRILGNPNCLASVTGATRDVSGGDLVVV